MKVPQQVLEDHPHALLILDRMSDERGKPRHVQVVRVVLTASGASRRSRAGSSYAYIDTMRLLSFR